MAARKTAKTPEKTSAAKVSSDLFIEVVGRKITLPTDTVLLRRTVVQPIPTADGPVDFTVFLVKKGQVDAVVADRWGFVIEDPALDCTQRELIQVDLGKVPVFE